MAQINQKQTPSWNISNPPSDFIAQYFDDNGQLRFKNSIGNEVYPISQISSSYALSALSASYAISASYETRYEESSSYADYAKTASYVEVAQTASYVNTALTASYFITSSVSTASYVANAQTASYVEVAQTASTVVTITDNGNNSHKVVFANTGTSNGQTLLTDPTTNDFTYNPHTGVLTTTASYSLLSNTAQTASFIATASRAITSSFALTASFVLGGGGGSTPNLQSVLSTGNQSTSSIILTASISTGTGSVASGQFSHAEGIQTRATTAYAHAEGYGTLASGVYAHAEGFQSSASAEGSHAEGDRTTTLGIAAHSEGQRTTAIGNGSHAEGYFTTAKANWSHADGFQTIANAQWGTVVGKNNIEDNNSLFTIGGGLEASSRSNILVAYTGSTNHANAVVITGSLRVSGSITLNGSAIAAGGGGTSATYFTYSGSHLYTTAWQTVNIPTGTVSVDTTKKFKIDFWGFNYYPDDFFGETFDNQGAVYGQPVTLWSDGWGGQKQVFNLGTSNKNSGYLYQVRVNYPGSGSNLQFQWKASGNMALAFITGVGGTLTYL
jgi:hypothetical protein